MFSPKLFHTLKDYSRPQFRKDLLAGLIVGIVALPLAIAFAIASGVSPEKGLYTAVIAGFIISVLGGSRVQIGGPTGAFIVIVYGIVQSYGLSGLIIATFLAGFMLILMGLARLGAVIKFIPYSVIVGFTSGIALVIFSSQVKDFFGLDTGAIPADFLAKLRVYVTQFSTINQYSTGIAIITLLIIIFWPKFTHKVPGSLVAIILTTLLVAYFRLPVDTIGSRFGSISASFPAPEIPRISFATLQHLVQPAFTIALLGAIESLLSAVVADGMIGANHKSNMELVAQGTANIFSSLFGGIPATGAIARTATNIRNGGRTPVAGIVHAVVLLLITLFLGKWAAYIPMPTLAGVLVVVAYNMSEWKNFVSLLRGPRGDSIVLITTFLLTVWIDLTVAIEIGMVLSVLLFMRKIIQYSAVSILPGTLEEKDDGYRENERYVLPAGVEVFEITGPLFFGAAYKFKDAMRVIERPPRVLIVRMRQVPMIDATGIKVLKDVHRMTLQQGTRLVLSEVRSEQVITELKEARLLFAIGKANVTTGFQEALNRAEKLMK